MFDRVVRRRAAAWILIRAHAGIVSTTMVCKVKNFQALRVPRMELLSHVLTIDLMDYYVEFVVVSKNTHLKLPAPGSTLAHQPDISCYRYVILHEKLVVLFFSL